jgi:hypothetical protein
MSATRSTKVTRWVLGATAAAAAAALVAALTLPVGHEPDAPAAPPRPGTVGASLLDAMPERPVMALTTPGTPQWWAYVAALSPSLRLSSVDIEKAPAAPLGYGYAQAKTRTAAVAQTVPLTAAVYVHAEDAPTADALVAWFATQPGHEARRGYRTGTSVILGPEWADRTEFDLAANATQGRAVNDDQATWTWDLGQWNQTVRARATNATTRDIAGSALASLGITDTTVLTTSSTSPTKPFVGQAERHATAKVNVGVLSAALRASDTVLFSTTKTSPQDKTGTTMTMSEQALSAILDDSAFTIHDGHGHGTTLGNGAVTTLLPENGTRSLAATFDPRAITDYATGHQTERGSSIPLTVQIDDNGKAAIAPAPR